MVPPAPISISSECAPRQRTESLSPGPTRDQSLEWIQHEFFAGLHIIKDLTPHQKETVIDPNVGGVRWSKPLDPTVGCHVNQMKRERRADGEKACNLSAFLKAVDHCVEIDVAETVAVVGEKKLLLLNVRAHGPKPLANIALSRYQ